MKTYNPTLIERKWQKIWEDEKVFEAIDFSEKPKFYGLVEFPYPSGTGLHVGHIRAYTSMEVIARKRRLEGYNVLFPIGWDAFGLPTENYALKTGEHPRAVTDRNIAVFTSQLKAAGYSFDWDRTIDTTDPNYYKWTQWIFDQMFRHDLAYKNKSFVNFCLHCKVVLSNEESQDGVCDRCNEQVVQMEKDVWFLKIRAYAEKLLEELPDLDYLPRIKLEQSNWIGKSVGAEVAFPLNHHEEQIKVFTTRPDTLFGVTFMVFAPEHPLLDRYRAEITNFDEVQNYRVASQKKTEFERVQLAKEKSGVLIQGLTILHPITKQELPIWISDYVMMGYGTGAIMAVPAHDTRDWEFAKKFDIPIIEVISGGDVENEAFTDTQQGILVNSDFLNGLDVPDAIQKMLDYLVEFDLGVKKTNYKMKDWAFNRQRYWGEPIPIIQNEDGTLSAVPENELPVTLPDVKNYQPTDTGESPLANISDWVNITDANGHVIAKRETDTMPQWAGSSWYFLRYIDPHNDKEFAAKEKLEYWGPVDWYNGGMEHVTRHMIYSRFWNRFLYDIGVVPFKEPYKKRTAQGLILGSDGEKMSKSRGNVINPNTIIDEFGADTLRMYIMFIGDYEKPAIWSDNGVKGCHRFLDRVWRLQEFLTEEEQYSAAHTSLMHKLIKKVSLDYESMKFNTAIAAMMETLNQFYADRSISRKEFQDFLILLYPTAPHISEELWSLQNYPNMVCKTAWPQWDDALTVDDEIELPIQVNGKVRNTILIPKNASLEKVKELALKDEKVQSFTNGKTVIKEIYREGKIFNLVVK